MPGEGWVVLCIFGLEMIFRLGDDQVIDQYSWHLDVLRMQCTVLGDGLYLSDHDAAGIVYGLGNLQYLHMQAFLFQRQISVLVGNRSANQCNLNRETFIEQPFFAL
ncbi:hypothetical protein D3C77_468280 [compost metagenome]